MVPEGAIPLDPVGTAPGLVVPAGERTIVVLPGPPRELQPMWPAALEVSRLRELLERATPLHGYTLRMFGIPESEIAKSLREMEEEGVALPEVEITTCLRRGEIEIDVRYRNEAAATAEAVREGLAERHRAQLFSEDGKTIDAQVAELLAGHRLGLAESCSGGLLAARVTDLAGASSYMAGSVVAYSNEAKVELLGVDLALIERHGAVSPEVAEAMAKGAMERFSADVAVSITGVAGPDGGSEEKPVGYVCFNARLADGTVIAREPVIPGGRADIRERSALVGLHLLRMLLGDGEPPL
jgi:nicotinamide-nucleotide amidase